MVPCPQLIHQRKDLEQIISIDLISAIHGLRPLDLSFKIKIIEKTIYNCNMYKYAYVDSLLFHLPTSCPYFHISSGFTSIVGVHIRLYSVSLKTMCFLCVY